MILMDEMLPLKLYSSKQRAYLPFNPANKKKNAMVTLLTRSMQDSIDLINTAFFMNPNYFISYYMDRNVKRYLSNDGTIEIEGEADDPDEEFTEAVLYANPNKKSPVCTFVTKGTHADMALMEEYFKKKKFDEWYDYFRIEKSRRKYPTIYGCTDMKQMFDAIGDKAIMDHGKLIANSYNSDSEIFVLLNSEYAFDNADGPYELYCKGALITYVISVGCPKCSWELANNTAAALSGQADYIYKKNDFKIKDEKIQTALFISKMEKEKGRAAIVSMCKKGDVSPLAKYGAKDALKRFSALAMKQESAFEGVVLAEDVIDDMRHAKKDAYDYKSSFDAIMKYRERQVKHLYTKEKVAKARLDSQTTITNYKNALQKRKAILNKTPGSDDNMNRKRLATQIVDIEDFIHWLEHDYQDMLRDQESSIKEGAILESDGTPIDTMAVLNSLNKRDRDFVGGEFDLAESSASIYRHIERDEEFLRVKGFIEIQKQPNTEPFVVLAVHPAYRGQHVGFKLVQVMLKEFHKEYPEYNSIVWRVNPKNKASLKLAEKMGFKLIKKNSEMICLRYEYKEDPLFKLIPDEIVNEHDIIKYCRSHFSIDYNAPIEQLYVIRDLKNIVRSRKINKFEMGFFIFTALKKIGYPAFYFIFGETNGSDAGLGDIEPVAGCFVGDYFFFNPFSPHYGSNGMIVADRKTNIREYFHALHQQGKWGDKDEYPVTFAAKRFDNPYEIEVGKPLYQHYLIPVVREMFPEGKPITESTELYFEFTTHSKLAPPQEVNNKLPANLSRLKKVKIDKSIVDKYGRKMEGLHHVRLTNSCTGYLYLDKKGEPVCYYNIQHKDADDTGHDTVWLQAVEVSEDYQGRTLGKQLLDKAVSDHHVTNLSVDKDNQVAIRLYKSMGFNPYISDGKMIYMEKKFTRTESWRPPENMTMVIEDQIFVFTDIGEQVLSEALSQTAYNTKLRQYLWKERIRTSSAQLELFEKVKLACPKIRKAYVNPKMYRGLNLFMDMSYYNGLFLANNLTKKDIAINFYWEYLNRMINSTNEYFRTTYTKNTIFIPIWKGAWDCKEGTFVYDWKVNLNPISMIFRMIRKNPAELRKWGNTNFIFIGRNGYFRVDFSRFQIKDLVKFKTRLNKLWNLEKIEDDPDEDGYGRTADENDEEHSSSAIAVKVIDDIEQSTGVEINDVSKAIRPTNVEDNNSNDPSTTEIVPNLRIRNSKIPVISDPASVGIVAPTTDDTVRAANLNGKQFSSKIKYIYKP